MAQAVLGSPRSQGPYFVGSKLHPCLSLHQRGADLHDHGLYRVGTAPALGHSRDKAGSQAGYSFLRNCQHLSSQEAAFTEGPLLPAQSPPVHLSSWAQALPSAMKGPYYGYDLSPTPMVKAQPAPPRPMAKSETGSLTCLVRSSMQMAPPPRTYLQEEGLVSCARPEVQSLLHLLHHKWPIPFAQSLTLQRGLETQP